MQRSVFRVAVIFKFDTAFTRRLVAGANCQNSAEYGHIIREFILGDCEGQLPREFTQWRPDAVISFLDHSANNHHHLFCELNIRGLPVVNTARGLPRPDLGVVIASASDQFDSIVDHFQSINRKHIAHVILGRGAGAKAVHDLYQLHANKRQITHHCLVIPDRLKHYNFPARLGKTDVLPDLARWLCALPPQTGIFTLQVHAARYLCRVCQLLGLKVPDRVAIIGNDGFDVASQSVPSASSVWLPVEKIGAQAMKLLLEMIGGRTAPHEPIVIRDARIIARESTQRDRVTGFDIRRAIDFIERHACEGITVNDVVHQTQGVTRKTFGKYFFEETEKKAIELIRELKLMKARRLLTTSHVSVAVVSVICGFSSDTYFRKVFKAAEGVSPQAYRNLQQEAFRRV